MLKNITKSVYQHIGNNNSGFIKIVSRNMSVKNLNAFDTLSVKEVKPFVYHVELNRPDKLNAFNVQMVDDLGDCFNTLNEHPDCRAIVLSASGKHFTAGLDLRDMMVIGQKMVEIDEVGRIGQMLGNKIRSFQKSISSLETCNKPVIVTVHSACIGAGVDLISAADIRYGTKDSWYQVKEVDIGMAADVGTLQRFPKAIGSQSLARELCFTGRKFDASEAFTCGFLTKLFDDRNKMIEEAINVAELIATKSPIAVQATKKNMVYSLEHTNQDGLDQIYEMNKLLLQSKDFLEACMAQATKGDPPVFAKL